MTIWGFKKRVRIATWNVQTMYESSKLAQICKEFSSYNLYILGLSEIRWTGHGELTTNSGELLLYSGKDVGESHESGVGFLLSKAAKSNILDWKPINDRIITLRIKTKARNMTIIQCYAPTETSAYEDKEIFYQKLSAVMEKIPHGDIRILMGDLNAKVGSNNLNVERTIGKHGLGSRNTNGDLLVELCAHYNLVIGGTLFPHKTIHKGTWTSPDRKTVNQIDHLAISGTWRTSLLDVRNRRGADVGSDHLLVVGEFRLKLYKKQPNSTNSRPKFNLDRLKIPKIAKKFTNTLKERIHENLNINENKDWPSIQPIYLSVGKDIVGLKTNDKKSWISERTWALIQERKEAKNIQNAARSPSTVAYKQMRYSNLNKQVKRSARADKRRGLEDLAKRAQMAAEIHDSRSLYHFTRKLSGNSSLHNKPLKNKSGETLCTVEAELARWHEHFEEQQISLPTEQVRINSPINNRQTLKINTSCPSSAEIKNAIKAMKASKAAGPDAIPSEFFKVDAALSAEILVPVLKKIWNDESTTPNWSDGLIIALPKKGDLSDCKNWRGITLLNVIYKILAHIINNRLQEHINPRLRPEQAGFRLHRSCIDQINTLRIIVEQSVEWRSPLFLIFVDFERAFDSLQHLSIWSALQDVGVPDKITQIIKCLYTNAHCRVLHKGRTSDSISVNTGVRQGDVLSPMLFNIVLDAVMRKVTNTKHGITWNLFSTLEDLDYADDICLIAPTYHDMKAKLSVLISEAEQVGLKINVQKTKAMCINTDIKSFDVQGTILSEVEEFCYLGSIITKDGGSASDVLTRINKANQAFGVLRNIWKSSFLALSTKLRIFKTNVLSVLLYGCETWKSSAVIENKLQVFVQKCLRKILHIFWPNIINNEELLARTGIGRMATEIKMRKWKWIGHTLRGTCNITKDVLEWNPQGSRSRGRPRLTWRRTIIKELESVSVMWKEAKAMAKNRVRWRSFVEALCSL